MPNYTVLPANTPICDSSDMEIFIGEHAMAARLNNLGWHKTERFTAYTLYRNKQRKVIGITVFNGSCDCKHYALRLA